MPIASKLDGYARALLTYYPKNDRANGAGSGFTAWDARFFVRNLTNTDKTHLARAE